LNIRSSLTNANCSLPSYVALCIACWSVDLKFIIVRISLLLELKGQVRVARIHEMPTGLYHYSAPYHMSAFVTVKIGVPMTCYSGFCVPLSPLL
jgi:hypothetical protein